MQYQFTIQIIIKAVRMLHQSKGKAYSIPLVSHEEQGFKLHEEAMNFLESLPKNKKIHVLSIVGKVKTGKSYLLNKLIHIFKHQSSCQEEYFPISNHLNHCTKGINILNSWIQTNDGIILVLDMEGLGSLANTNSYDSKLFAIGMLLSSTIIYNNVGPIDQQALQNLSFLIEIGKLFDKSISETTNGLGLPSLFMVLRDFSLTFENKQGIMVTPKQYFQECLEQQKGVSETIATKNRIRRVIKSLFTCRNCQSLILPSEDVPINFSSAVRDQFMQDVKRLSGKLLVQIKENPKCIKNQSINIGQYALYVRQFVEVLNNSGNMFPRFDSILVQVYRKQTKGLALAFSRQMGEVRSKYQQIVDRYSSYSYRSDDQQIDDGLKMKEAEKVMTDYSQIVGSIRSGYIQVCQQIEALIKKQDISDVNVDHLEYQNPRIAKIRQFKDVYDLKSQFQSQVAAKIKQMQIFISKQKNRLRKKQDYHQQIQKLKNLVDGICEIQSQRQLEGKYLEFISGFKASSKHLSNSVMQNHLLKLQVAYLRRKLQLKERRDGIQNSPIKIEEELEQEQQQPVLKKIQLNMQSCTHEHKTNHGKPKNFENKMIETLASFASKQIKTLNQAQPSKELLPKSMHTQKTACNFQNTKSFYVPYVMISDSSIMNVEIVRTLIKQDSKKTNYLQYVLEVVLTHKRWMFNRKWKDFCELNNILHNLFDKDLLPVFEPSIIGVDCVQERWFVKQSEVEEGRHRLQRYLRKLLEVQTIRNSRIMQKFLKINKQYITTL